MNKTHNSLGVELHPITRARERLGKEWDGDAIYDIALLIRKGEALLLGSEPSKGTEVYLVQYDGLTFKTVFDLRTNMVVTFFSRGMKMSRCGYNKRTNGKQKRGGKYRKNRKG